MNYPVWYLPHVGGGILIAIIAVTHVFVSHFAVGGGLYLIYAEKKALREHNEGLLAFVKSHAKFFLLITMVYGSITGVGIWFIIALVNPAATSLLIHNFVFGWAIEWIFFVLEITAAFIYFYTFGKMENSTHLKIGWIYFISAWASLFLIAGIIDFMLTPGAWVEKGGFWVGFFNPSFIPSIFFRTFLATLLAGVYGYLTAAFHKDKNIGKAMTSFSGRWALISLVLAIPCGFWYLSVLPAPEGQLITGGSPTIQLALQYGFWAIVLMAVFSLLLGLIKPSLNSKPLAILVFITAFVIVGSFEWTREAARRPYVISEVMYSNGILKSDIEGLQKDGFLNQAKWVKYRSPKGSERILVGHELFVNQCYACHTNDGWNNDLKIRTANMSYRAMTKYIGKLHKVRYFMPPFAGTDDEAKALAAYMAVVWHGREAIDEAPQPQNALELGKTLYEDNCSSCHELEDYDELIEDWPQQKIREALDQLPDLNDEMEDLEASDQEKDALATYLFSLHHEIESPQIDGAMIFEDNCTSCHEKEDYEDLIFDWDLEKIRDGLDKLPELNEEMEPFEGTAAEKDALADFLYSIKGGEQ